MLTFGQLFSSVSSSFIWHHNQTLLIHVLAVSLSPEWTQTAIKASHSYPSFPVLLLWSLLYLLWLHVCSCWKLTALRVRPAGVTETWGRSSPYSVRVGENQLGLLALLGCSFIPSAHSHGTSAWRHSPNPPHLQRLALDSGLQSCQENIS